MKSTIIRVCLAAGVLFYASLGFAQIKQPRFFSLEWADTLHKPRFRTAMIGGTGIYALSMTGLWKAWYADYPLGDFHTFNDNDEWNQMDKCGHALMAYQEARWAYHGARWTGLNNRKAAWTGFAAGQLIQGSFEIFDGFSEQWGFSWGDMGFNLMGGSLFLGQQLAWKEQRLQIKLSAMPVQYSNETLYPISGNGPPISLDARAEALYGTGPVNLFLKNYNTMAIWMSVNPRSFTGDQALWIPRWLNLSMGAGADNLFGGRGNTWQETANCNGPDCPVYSADPARFPRTRQWFLSFDVDLSKLPVKNRFFRTFLVTANIFKIPSPTLEWTNQGRVKWHWLYF